MQHALNFLFISFLDFDNRLVLEECLVGVTIFVVSVLFPNSFLGRACFVVVLFFDNLNTAKSGTFCYNVSPKCLLGMKLPIFSFFMVNTCVSIMVVVIGAEIYLSFDVELLTSSTIGELLIAESLG